VKTHVDLMLQERKKANKLTSLREMAVSYDEKVKAYFDVIRYHVDKLELLVDDELWPLPKYRELLFFK
jgi:glutamine synthetase